MSVIKSKLFDLLCIRTADSIALENRSATV